MTTSMRSLLPLLLMLAAAAPAACGQSTATSAPTATLIRDAQVFDGDTVHERASVLVRDGLIAAIGADLDAPDGATIVDAEGMTLLPGLIDSHTHAFGDALREALVFGVTTELDMFTDPALASAMRAEQADGRASGRADLFSAGYLATAPGGHGTEYGMPVPTITSADSAQAWVDARLAEGSDYIKIVYDDGALFGLNWPMLDRSILVALIEAAHSRDRLAVVHISTAAQAMSAIEAGADGLVHLFTDSMPTDAFIDAVRAHDAFVIPTMVVLKSITGYTADAPVVDDARLTPYLVPASRINLEQTFPSSGTGAQFAVPLETVARLHAAGVPILAGTDAPNPGTAHGSSMHGELALLVEAGLTSVEALRSGTSVPADAFGLEDRGRIAEGMRADLLLVRGDPTVDITATRDIEGVWKGGTRLDRAAYAQEVAATPTTQGPVAMPDNGVLSDFESGSASAQFGSAWVSNTDSFAGGTSSVAFEVVDGGANGSAKALRVSGEITDALPYAWAGVMWSPTSTPMAPANLSEASGLRFYTRGDGRSNRVLVFSQAAGMTPLMHEFVAPVEWTEVVMPWSAVGIDGSDVMAILFVGSPPAGEFWFEVDDVTLR